MRRNVPVEQAEGFDGFADPGKVISASDGVDVAGEAGEGGVDAFDVEEAGQAANDLEGDARPVKPGPKAKRSGKMLILNENRPRLAPWPVSRFGVKRS
ncbi:MAG: hypothetical protein K2X03_07455 [Bryobacteraceae bacterium]|nr:hypothetical protein [Bryobacteraceae bacterium]